MENLENRLGGKRRLADCRGLNNWPRRGVYFFFEDGENRSSGSGLRVVRVGTHAIKDGEKSTLWGRLRTHRGTLTGNWQGGGNHRGSVFRRHIGTAILRKGDLEKLYPTWGIGSSAPRQTKKYENPIELEVSKYIGNMPFLWLEVDDPPSPESRRAFLESNVIALLSNYKKLETDLAIDTPSEKWLGKHCKNGKVRGSGLWNDEHVEKNYAFGVTDELEKWVRKI